MPVPATTSRARKPKIAVNELERNDERDEDHPERVALGRLDPAELQAAQEQRAPRQRQESERERIRDRSERDARAGVGRDRSMTSGGLHAATTSACGAASFMRRAGPCDLDGGLAFASLNHVEQLAIAGALRRLTDERPRRCRTRRP